VTDVDIYLNFALHAILGRLSEADALMSLAGDEIRAVADRLAAQHPIASGPLYRGMLLDPDEPFAADPKLTFLSWSEDRDVALWFACPRSVVSEPLAATNPKLRGYLVELPARSQTPRVLFHYGWTRALGGLAALARVHPLMGEEGRRQIEWSLRTQREVITAPIDGLQPSRTADLDADALVALERRLSPPWVIAEEGIRS
jgi:hypothetical protein